MTFPYRENCGWGFNHSGSRIKPRPVGESPKELRDRLNYDEPVRRLILPVELKDRFRKAN